MDRRELILERLMAVLVGINWSISTGKQLKIFRNRGELTGQQRPAVILYDADESADPREKARGRPAYAPNLIYLQPQIYVALDTRVPPNLNVGEDLSSCRKSIAGSVLNDAELTALVEFPTGEIRYSGCMTDLKKGDDMEGQMNVAITFTYPLKPDELLS
jgi:hypothetical protein